MSNGTDEYRRVKAKLVTNSKAKIHKIQQIGGSGQTEVFKCIVKGVKGFCATKIRLPLPDEDEG